MKNISLVILLFIPLLSFSQNETSPSIDLDSFVVDNQKNAFKSYQDSFDTYLSRLDKGSREQRNVHFKIERNDTIKAEGTLSYSSSFNIENLKYISINENFDKTLAEERLQKILKVTHRVYKVAFYKFYSKRFECEYSGKNIWKFSGIDETREYDPKGFEALEYYRFGVEIKKGRIAFIKTKLKEYKGPVEEQYIHFDSYKEKRGIYLLDSEVIINKSKDNRYRFLLDFK